MIEFERANYYEDDDFRVYMEIIKDQLFVHVVIYKFSKSVLARMKEMWALILIDAYFEGYENVFTYTKDNRIVGLIGGAEKIGQHEAYEVWKWDLN